MMSKICYNREVVMLKFIWKLFLISCLIYFATGSPASVFNFSHKVYAQTQPPKDLKLIVPTPIWDLVNEINNIKINFKFPELKFFEDLSQIKNISLTNEEVPDFIRGIINNIGYTFDLINNWFEEKIGLNFFRIIKIIGSLFIWVLQKLIQLIRLGLEALPSRIQINIG